MSLHHATMHMKWEAPEFIYQKNGADWFWGIGLLCLVGAGLSIWLNNFLLLVIILLATFLIVTFSLHKPKNVSVEVSDHGFKMDGVMHSFNEYDYFWIDADNEDLPKLLLHSTTKVLPSAILPISPEVNLEELRELCDFFLDEVEMREPIVHRFLERIGF